MTFIEEVAIPIVEVAKRANLTLDELRSEASQVNMFIGLDWKHQEGHGLSGLVDR
jgi:hypothetical protein